MANEFIARKGIKILEIPEETTLTGSTISIIDSDGKLKQISVPNFYNESGINDAKTTAENAAITATEQANISITKANEASISASNALISEQNADLSKTEAEIAATLSTQQAVLSASARDAAIAAQLAAENSEDNAAASEASALLSAQASAQSALESEAARDEIVNKIDFTGASEGDIFRVNNLGVAVKINETDFLRSKVPFGKSAILAYLGGSDKIFAWDNFDRPNGDPIASENGLPYVSFGAPTISNKSLTSLTSGPSGVQFPYNYRGFTAIINGMLPVTIGNQFPYFGIRIIKDSSNYIDINYVTQFLRISKIINGVVTTISNVSDSSPFLGSNGNRFTLNVKLTYNPTDYSFFLSTIIPTSRNVVVTNLSSDNDIRNTFISETDFNIGVFCGGLSGTSIDSYIILK